jgi:hypothetical protein
MGKLIKLTLLFIPLSSLAKGEEKDISVDYAYDSLCAEQIGFSKDKPGKVIYKNLLDLISSSIHQDKKKWDTLLNCKRAKKMLETWIKEADADYSKRGLPSSKKQYELEKAKEEYETKKARIESQ